jgi:hypothetical protein
MLNLYSNLAPPPPPLSDPFDFFNMMIMPDVPLGDLDWLNIESEENIRPRKRQNIITISRMYFTCFVFFDINFFLFR